VHPGVGPTPVSQRRRGWLPHLTAPCCVVASMNSGMAWSACCAQAALLAATSGGTAYVWTQVPCEGAGEPQAVATNVWHGRAAFQVAGEPCERPNG
jgi:hypothetical protein